MAADVLRDRLADLREAFPSSAATVDTLRLYHRELSDLPPDVAATAVASVMRTAQFFPSIGELRDAAASLMTGLPDEAEALAEVERYVTAKRVVSECSDCGGRGDVDDVICQRCRGTGDAVSGPPPINDQVKEALQLVGGVYGYRNADEPSVVRGQFLRLYREIRAREMRAVRVGGPAALPAGVNRRELGPADADVAGLLERASPRSV